MSGRRYSPKRRLRSEIFPLLVIMSLPVALWLVFPAGAVGFRPVERPRSAAVYNAFVSLGDEREAELLVAARSAWQSDSSSRRGIRANLLDFGSSAADRITSGIRPSGRVSVDPVVPYECDFIPSGLAAEAPAMLTPDRQTVPDPAFPKSDLLKLN